MVQVDLVLDVFVTEEGACATFTTLEALLTLPVAGRDVYDRGLKALEVLCFLATIADDKAFPVAATVTVGAENAVVAKPVLLELSDVVLRRRGQAVRVKRFTA